MKSNVKVKPRTPVKEKEDVCKLGRHPTTTLWEHLSLQDRERIKEYARATGLSLEEIPKEEEE